MRIRDFDKPLEPKCVPQVFLGSLLLAIFFSVLSNSPSGLCENQLIPVPSLRTADAFPVVASLPRREREREATTGNAVPFSLLKWRILTSLPAILLCRFIIIRAGFPVLPRSLASTNFVENSIPYSMSSLHPAHFQPFLASPVYFWSHPHFRPSLPALHECVTAYATPADEMEWTNAASLVPSKLKTRTTTTKNTY